MARICIVGGSGYVGLGYAAALADLGNDVIGLDVAADRVAALNRGEPLIYEPGLEELLSRNLAAGRLRFTTDYTAAVPGADFVFLCVGTPSLSNGDADMLADAVRAAQLEGVFDAVLSVVSAGVFKPSMKVYQLVIDRFGGAPADVSFQSSNRWDIAGAKAFGFTCVWINRTGALDEYPDLPPDRVVSDLRALVA